METQTDRKSQQTSTFAVMKNENNLTKITDGGPILFFDGVCNLCNGAVDFIIRHDRSASIRFVAIQSEIGQLLLKNEGFYGADGVFLEKKMNTLIFLKDGKTFIKSDATLQIAQIMGGGWRIFSVARWLPRSFRDAVYDFMARNRYRFFGKKESCRLPSPAERGRLLS